MPESYVHCCSVATKDSFVMQERVSDPAGELGFGAIYVKDDKNLYYIDEDGVVQQVITSVTDLWERVGTVLSPNTDGDTVQVGAGTLTQPAYSFEGDTDTGVTSSDVNQMSLVNGGVVTANLSASSANFLFAVNVDGLLTANADVVVSGVPTSPWIRNAADTMGFEWRTGIAMWVDSGIYAELFSSSFDIQVPVREPTGSAVTPTFSHVTDTNTGMYLDGADAVYFSTAGVQRLKISAAGAIFDVALTANGDVTLGDSALDTIDVNGVFISDLIAAAPAYSVGAIGGEWLNFVGVGRHLGGDGSAASPTFSDVNDLDTGMYFGGVDSLYLSVGGAFRVEVLTTSFRTNVQIRTSDGSAAAPAYAFTSATSTGMFTNISGDLGFSILGTQELEITTDRIAAGTVTLPSGQFVAGDGAVGTGGFAFSAGAAYNTGLFAADSELAMTMAVAGVTIFSMSNLGIASMPNSVGQRVTVPDGTAAACGLGFTGDTNTGLIRTTTDTMGLVAGGSARRTISTTSEVFTEPQQGGNESATAPTYSFSGDTNTGMFHTGVADNLGFSTGGTVRLTIVSSTQFTATLPWRGQDGTAAAPAFSFSGDTNTGMYRVGVDDLGFAAGGTAVANVDAASFDFAVPVHALSGAALSETALGVDNVRMGVASTPRIILEDATFTQWEIDNELGILRFFNPGSVRMRISTTFIETFLPILAQSGSVTAPAYSFSADTNTGIYHTGTADTIGVTTGGTVRITVSTTVATFSIPIDQPEAAAPANPSANTARFYTIDDSGITHMAYRDSGGAVTNLAHAFYSTTVTSNSTASAVEYDVFDDGNYPAFSNTVNVEAKDISYDSTTGRFTVTAAGKYKIDCVLILESAGIQTCTIDLNKNDSTIWTAVPTVHSSVDPVERTISIIVDANASDYFNVTVDGASANITIWAGTTFSIHRLN